MSRQSDIKDGLKRILGDERLVAKTLSFLEKEKVVIKVERDLPKPDPNACGQYLSGYCEARQDMLKSGYVAVESLIKEE